MTKLVGLIQVGIEAWNSARDSTGSTPEDYARLRGHYSYIHLVQKKINKKSAAEHVVLDIHSVLSDCSVNKKQNNDIDDQRMVSLSSPVLEQQPSKPKTKTTTKPMTKKK